MDGTRHLIAGFALAIIVPLLVSPALGQQAPRSTESQVTAPQQQVATGTPAAKQSTATPKENAAQPAFGLRAVGIALGFAAVAVLAWCVLLLVFAMIRAIERRGDTVAVYANWSGFGGGLTGWSLSRTFSLLLSALLLGTLTVALANAVSRAVSSDATSSAPRTASTAQREASTDDKARIGTTDKARATVDEAKSSSDAAGNAPQTKTDDANSR